MVLGRIAAVEGVAFSRGELQCGCRVAPIERKPCGKHRLQEVERTFAKRLHCPRRTIRLPSHHRIRELENSGIWRRNARTRQHRQRLAGKREVSARQPLAIRTDCDHFTAGPGSECERVIACSRVHSAVRIRRACTNIGGQVLLGGGGRRRNGNTR